MKILITGHKGFIGRRLMEALEKIHADIVGIDIKEDDDLLNCYLPETEFDIIFHLAAQTSVEKSWENPYHDAQNIMMTIRLAQQYPHGKIIYTQSAAAEDASSPYGLSKKTAEEYLKMLHHNTVVCVLPNIFGPGGKGVVDLFKGKDEVTIYGSGRQTRDFVHVDDIVDGLISAIKWANGTYCFGSEYGIQIGELGLYCGAKRFHYADPRKEIFESILKNTTPGWKPKIKVLEYIRQK